MVSNEDAERVAWAACVESRMRDRPSCDPLAFAVGALGLELMPMCGVEAHVIGRRLYYPSDDAPDAIAYCVAHECGHELAADAFPGIDAETEERVASRIGVGLLLPGPPYLRDVAQYGWDLWALCDLWPLASPWIHARRIAEVDPAGAVASRWLDGACVGRVIAPWIPATPSPVERALARVGERGESIDAGPRVRTWPLAGGGTIVVCGVSELRRAPSVALAKARRPPAPPRPPSARRRRNAPL